MTLKHKTIDSGLLLILVIWLSAGCQHAAEVSHVKAKPFTASEKLFVAYAEENSWLLYDFLADWEQAVLPVNEYEVALNDEITGEVYSLYSQFYQPFNLTMLGPTEKKRDYYKGVKNLIVQDSLVVEVLDEGKCFKKFEIKDFRPRIQFPNVRVLYLAEGYREILESFLYMTSDDLAEKTKVNKGVEERRRMAFLNQAMKLSPGHWGGVLLETYPQASKIEFNKALTKAKVHFRIVFEGGDAYFEKVNGKWLLTSSGFSWIQ